MLKSERAATAVTATINTIILMVTAVSIAAWVTHCYTCIATEQWVLLAIGAIVFPVGVVHGISLWL